MPLVDSHIHKIGNAAVLFTLDLTKGYWQILLESESKAKTAFTTMAWGGGIFSEAYETLRGVQDCAVVYIDDILVQQCLGRTPRSPQESSDSLAAGRPSSQLSEKQKRMHGSAVFRVQHWQGTMFKIRWLP